MRLLPASPLRVLIADGDPAQRYLYASFLEGTVFEVQCLERSEDLHARCAAALPHCIVLGDELPSDGPMAALRQLRDEYGRAAPAVVQVGGSTDVYEVLRALRAGVDEYLTRSEVSPAQLERAVRHAIDRRAVRSALGDQADLVATAMSELDSIRQRLEIASATQSHVLMRVVDAIRTPLGIIANAMETLEQTDGDPQTLAKLLPMMRRAVAHLDLVAQMLGDAGGSVLTTTVTGGAAAPSHGVEPPEPAPAAHRGDRERA